MDKKGSLLRTIDALEVVLCEYCTSNGYDAYMISLKAHIEELKQDVLEIECNEILNGEYNG